jgi:hypothetical protein
MQQSVARLAAAAVDRSPPPSQLSPPPPPAAAVHSSSRSRRVSMPDVLRHDDLDPYSVVKDLAFFTPAINHPAILEVKSTLTNIVMSTATSGLYGRARGEVELMLRRSVEFHGPFQTMRGPSFDLELQSMFVQIYARGHARPDEQLLFEYMTPEQVGMRCVMTPTVSNHNYMLELLVRINPWCIRVIRPNGYENDMLDPLYVGPDNN